MKNNLLIIFFSFLSVNLICQCPTGIVTLSNQDQINQFQVDYPNCTQLFRLCIGDCSFPYSNTNIVDLTPLSGLEIIDDELTIRRNAQLEDLTGLHNLTSIGTGSFDHLEIVENNNLLDLTGLASLSTISGSLVLNHNQSLVTLNGLNSLGEIGHFLSIFNNNNLSDIGPLPMLTSINGVGIFSGPSIQTVTGINQITSTGSSMTIKETGLQNLNNFTNLTWIGGKLTIENNDDLVDISGLTNINPVSITGSGDDLIVRNNTNLSSCAITSVCDFLLLPNRTADVQNNMTGCNNVTEINEDCGNFSCSIPTIESQLDVDEFLLDNPLCSEIAGNLIIDETNNNSIINLQGLQNIKTINGSLIIQNNGGLTNLVGLDSLTSINGSLIIENCSALTSLQALSNITSINGSIEINYNFQLPSLAGLHNISAAGINNPLNSLADCEVFFNSNLLICNLAPFCDLIQDTSKTVEIHNNKGNCSDEEFFCEPLYPISSGQLDQCENFLSIDINSGNNEINIPLFNNANEILGYLNAKGQNLGNVDVNLFVSSQARTSNNVPYLKRNIEISVENQPDSFVFVRLFITEAEFDDLIESDPSIFSIDDIAFTKSESNCSPTFSGIGEFVSQDNAGIYNAVGDYYIDILVSSFSEFFAHSASRILPIELSHFRVELSDGSTNIAWQTLTETNNQGFEIQHSTTAENWSKLGWVNGQGNSVEKIEYSFTHRTPSEGINYYRLMQVDQNGAYEFFPVKSVLFDKDEELFFYPNPVHEVIYLNEETSYNVLDLNGVVKYQGIGKSIEVHKLPAGVYFLRSGKHIKRFIKL